MKRSYEMLESQEIIKIIKDKYPEIKKRFHVIEIGLFGSCARDEAEEGSDIDLLVEMEEGYNDLFNLIDLKDFLESVLNAPVEIIPRRGIRQALKDRIFKETIYV